MKTTARKISLVVIILSFLLSTGCATTAAVGSQANGSDAVDNRGNTGESYDNYVPEGAEQTEGFDYGRHILWAAGGMVAGAAAAFLTAYLSNAYSSNGKKLSGVSPAYISIIVALGGIIGYSMAGE
jgi:hypothetical protein